MSSAEENRLEEFERHLAAALVELRAALRALEEHNHASLTEMMTTSKQHFIKKDYYGVIDKSNSKEKNKQILDESVKAEKSFGSFIEEAEMVKAQTNQIIINILVKNFLRDYLTYEIRRVNEQNNDITVLGFYPAERDTYEIKQSVVKFLNSHARQYGAALAHPETSDPCSLFALPTKDKSGRYTLENRKTKKRSGYYKSIVELFPIKLVPDVPRKEGFLEARKKKDDKPAE